MTDSLVVRQARVEESGRLAVLLGQAYPTEKWEAAGTEQVLFHDKSVKAPLVVVQEERILATATLHIHAFIFSIAEGEADNVVPCTALRKSRNYHSLLITLSNELAIAK